MAASEPSSQYTYLYNLIQTRTGLTLDDHRRGNIMRVADELMTTMRLTSVHSLSLALTLSPLTHPLWQQLIQTITVGETYFFRNQAQFNALRNHILPALIARRRQAGDFHLRLWSAGCATGEEPYSLAILLRELLPDLSLWNITLLATDLNAASMDFARRGVYRPWSFRNETPPEVQARWFKQRPDGYELDRAIRNMVTFAPLNLVNDDYPSADNNTLHMDLIICRNVTIYFDQATTRRVVERFNRALIPDGWLIVGHAEPVASIYQDQGFEPRNFPDTVLYQKISAAAAPTPTAWSAATVSTDEPLLLPAPKQRPNDQEEAAMPPSSHVSPERSPAGQRVSAAPPIAPEMQPSDSPVIAQNAWEQARRAADQGNQHEALAWLDKAEQQDSLQPQVHYLRALIQLQIDNREGALVSLRQAVYCDPSFALAHYSLGTLYQQRGEYRTAARHWRMAQQAIADLDADHPLPYAEDITVEMLRGLLSQRLQELPASTARTTEVPRVSL